jgi:membrane protein DedA with SNARE-associated domain/membrane-associated phospholipid phosphatase
MFVETIKPLTNWLYLHPHWASFICFGIAFAESLAIIGTVVPGSVTLTALGVLIGSGVIPAVPSIIAAMLGGFLGDGLTFWLGYHYQDHLRDMWPFKDYPHILAKGERFVAKHGGKSIFIGRFVGPVRSVLPMIAGMLDLSPRRFLIADFCSAILWAPAYMLPGILLGAATLELPPHLATHLLMWIFISLSALWVLYYLFKFVGGRCWRSLNRLLDNIWQGLAASPKTQFFYNAIKNEQDPNDAVTFKLLILGIFLIALFSLLTTSITSHGYLTTFNEPLFYLLSSLRTQTIDTIMLMVTFLGEPRGMLMVIMMVFAWLIITKQHRLAAVWLFNGIIAAILIKVCKTVISSPRPDGLMVIRDSFSFPSGHVTMATAVYGLLAILLSQQTEQSIRKFIASLTAIIIGIIALSRLSLGAHWLTDVLGGLLLGSLCLVFSTITLKHHGPKDFFAKRFASITLLAIFITWSGFMAFQFMPQSFRYSLYFPYYPTNMATWWQGGTHQLPTHRFNRRGQPEQTFNVQWAGSLKHIQKNLSKAGWTLAPDRSFTNTIRRLLAQDKTQQLPLLSKLYRNQYPALVMVYRLNHGKPLLIVRLWRSGFYFTDSNTPLWIGTVHYRFIWHHKWLQSHQISVTLSPPLTILRPQLSNKDWQDKIIPRKHADSVYNLLIVKELTQNSQGLR